MFPTYNRSQAAAPSADARIASPADPAPSYTAPPDAQACAGGCGPAAPIVPDPGCRPTYRQSVAEYTIDQQAEMLRFDRSLVRSVLGARPRGLIPLVSAFGCYRLRKSQPEDGTFGVFYDPLRLMLTGGLYDVDQEVSLTNSQGEGESTPPTEIFTQLSVQKSGSYRVIGCRIEFDTTAQQAPANNALTTWKFAPWSYNANGQNLRYTRNPVSGAILNIDEAAKITDSNKQQWSMAAQTTGGAYVLFALRNVLPEFPAGPPGNPVSVTIPSDALLQNIDPNTGTPEGGYYLMRGGFVIEARTTGLVAGAQISQNVTILGPGQPHFEDFVSQFLAKYYEPVSTTIS